MDEFGARVALVAGAYRGIGLEVSPGDGPTGGFFRDGEPLAW